MPPARVGLVELADQGGEFEVARAGCGLGEAVELGARFAGHVAAHDTDRAGRTGVDLGLASALEAVEPEYQMLPGWKANTRGLSRYQDLPPKACDYLKFLSDHTGVEIGCISTSPEREETILVSGSKLEKLLLNRSPSEPRP